jgi:hypothetical protein
MRTLPRLLVLSLAANGVLAALWLREPERIPAAQVISVVPTEAEKADSALLALASNPQAEPGNPIRLWDRLHEEDLRVVVDRMRSAGFPERELHAVVTEVVAERESVRRAALQRQREQPPYWRRSRIDIEDEETFRELERQMAADRAVLWSMPPASRHDGLDLRGFVRTNPSAAILPAAKWEILSQIADDYAELNRTVLRSQGLSGPDVYEKLRLIELEYERDVRAALSPEEYEAFRLREGATANQLRHRLEAFLPTEEEYKAIHTVHESVRLEFVDMQDDETAWRAQERALEARSSQIEAVLGPERFADYRQALREEAREVNRLLVFLGLPLRVGGHIEEMRREFVQRAESVRADSSLPPTERDARLAALKQEARTRVSAALGGDRNLGAYEEMERWIRDLRPAP